MGKFKLALMLSILAFSACSMVARAQAPGVPSNQVASPTGLEQIHVDTGGSMAAIINLNQARNATGHALVAAGTTVTSAPTNAVGVLMATGAITTWAVTLPNPAYDGEEFSVANGTGSTFSSNTTVTAATTPQAQVLAQSYSSQSLSAGAAAQWIFDFATLTWYRIR